MRLNKMGNIASYKRRSNKVESKDKTRSGQRAKVRDAARERE